jgi:hypothetical protein
VHRRGKHALAASLVVVAAAGALPLLTSSSFSGTTGNDGNSIAALPDWIGPTVGVAAIAKTTGGSVGFIKRSGTYYVYAAPIDSGAPPSGIGTVKADVSTITTGQTAVPLVAGTYNVGGVAYQYRSAQLTARSTLTAGTVAYSVTATDRAAGTTSASFSVTADITAPSASAVSATNVAGGTIGRPELGDSLILTYSEPMDWTSILAGWDGTTTDVMLALIDGTGANTDYIQVYTPGLALLPLGTVYLNRSDVVTGGSGTYVAFGFAGYGTPTRMTASGSAVTLVLGTPTGPVGTMAAAAAMSWTPSIAAFDRAGNTASATARAETGTSDKDF